ncbi:sensor histidine kinase [Lacibacter sediminis]|uniref:ATP-binding protein n=1 Tax=Lacibacter sediminis TaxID=2760713 RepID=A0A7G5XKP0_9BACT|nr:ATP-binding protein [Lacibacter sediminis]QNA46043.1 ATP-binding protein [Lacibacter sediminis]
MVSFIVIHRKRRNQFIRDKLTMEKELEQQLLQSRIEVQEQTFQQIGKELHDNVGQLLSTSRMLIGLTERELKNPPDTLLTANATLGQAINEIRTLAKSLDKEWLERFSFSENIQTVIDRINAGEVIKASYEEQVPLLLRSDEQIILFRIVQEAVQNAVKHASPASILIRVQKEEEGYTIQITDDGRGFDTATVKRNMGLTNMQHRIHLLGGIINIQSSPGNGTNVHIYFPLQKKEL